MYLNGAWIGMAEITMAIRLSVTRKAPQRALYACTVAAAGTAALGVAGSLTGAVVVQTIGKTTWASAWSLINLAYSV